MFALVTGPTGFLGSHLVDRLLAAGHRVRALVYEPDKASHAGNAERIAGDITVPATLAPAFEGVDVVFHTAALVTNWAPWARFLRTTVYGTENALQAAARAGVKRFVHISTIRVYDDRVCRRLGSVDENAPQGDAGFRHFGRYARSKVLAEQAVWRMQATGALPTSVLRPAWIYGPGDHTIIPPLVRFLRGPGARWPGAVDPCADPIYVTDVADCAIQAALSPAAVGQAYNVAPPQRITLRAFLGALFDALDCRMPCKSVPYFLASLAATASEWWAWLRRRRDSPTYTHAGLAILTQDVRHEPAKAEHQLGWQARVHLLEGVRRTAAWIKERHPALLAA